ncbi:MAG: AAA family ATPase, partial [Anaerolineales bacterium]|nr:AAA family ATPase [Anaerolineales bacterium]
MAKSRTQYVCNNCGRRTPRHMGKCPQCGEFGTYVEEIIERPSSGVSTRRQGIISQPQRLGEVTAEGVDRLSLPLQELSRVLGGGLVPGGLVLLGGDPGIGKSTLLLEVAALVANEHGNTLYVSGEESVRQIKMRADRMEVKANDLFLVTETDFNLIQNHIVDT